MVIGVSFPMRADLSGSVGKRGFQYNFFQEHARRQFPLIKVTLFLALFVVTISALPSPFRSRMASPLGCPATDIVVRDATEPSRLIVRIVTLSASGFETATSAIPSPLTSPIAGILGRLPVTNGEPVILVNAPSPSPINMVSPSWPDRSEVLLGELTIARSSLPSALTSPIATLNGESPHGNGEFARLPKAAIAVAEKNGDVISFEIRADDVRSAIAVQIGNADSLVGVLSDGDVSAGRTKAALAIAEQDYQPVFRPTVGHQIKVSVAVEVAGGHAVDVRPDDDRERRAWCRGKSPLPVAEQHRHVLHFMVRDRQIKATVPVEISAGQIIRTRASGKWRAVRWREASPCRQPRARKRCCLAHLPPPDQTCRRR